MKRVDDLTGRRVYLDANVFIYAINLFPPFASVISALFAASDAGRITPVTSELTAAELLVKPFRDADAGHEAACRAMLFGSARLEVAPVTRDLLIESARLRATSGLKLPDAIHLATAALARCDAMLTNDARFRAAGPSLEVVLLTELTT